MNDLKDKLTDAFDQIDTTTAARAVTALLPLLSLLLPWITIDGDSKALTGGDAIAYALTSPERTTMFRTSLLGGLSLFTIPLITTALATLAFINTLNNKYPLALYAAVALLPILMLATISPITATTQKTIFGIIFPDWGVALTILPHAGLLAHGIWRNHYRDQEPQ